MSTLNIKFNWITTVNRIFFSLLLALCSIQSAHADLPDGIEVGLKSTQVEFGVKDEILLEVSYTNVSKKAIKLLIWGTALEGRINDDFLSITFDGNELPYMGLHIKRAPATEDDYVTIAPNETLSRKVDILLGYDIDYKGSYEIAPRDLRRISGRKIAPVTLKLLSDRPISFKRTPAVNGCPDGVAGLPNNRFVLADSAVSAAEGIAFTARNAMRNTPVSERANARRYREWFGVYNVTRWNTVQSHFDLIYTAVRNQTLVFECRDNESYFAAVIPSQPYRIFLGRAFWSAPRTGTDSKAGTIIHELSHFSVLGGTDDNVYGQSGARSLAINNPQAAAANADSHEYFAENTPFLSMPAAAPPPPPMPDPAPDLLVKQLGALSEEVRVGDSLSLSGVIENAGDAPSTAAQLSFRLSTDTQITANDPLLKQISTPALTVGSSSNFSVEVLLPAEEGAYWFGACVSSVSGEVETTNNCSVAIPLLVVKKPIVITPMLLLLLLDNT